LTAPCREVLWREGRRGSFIAKNHEDFKESIQPGMKYAIQEYVVGTRYYMHYFYSPLATTVMHSLEGRLDARRGPAR